MGEVAVAGKVWPVTYVQAINIITAFQRPLASQDQHNHLHQYQQHSAIEQAVPSIKMDDTQPSTDSTRLRGINWAESAFKFTIESARRYHANGALRPFHNGFYYQNALNQLRN